MYTGVVLTIKSLGLVHFRFSVTMYLNKASSEATRSEMRTLGQNKTCMAHI